MGAHTDVPCAPTAKRAAGFVNWMIRLNTSDNGRAWAIRHLGEVIGFLRFNIIDRRKSLAVPGYELDRPHWGKGLATEAVTTAVAYAHDELELHRLEATVTNGNFASARVLEKAGFQREGTQRTRILHRSERRDLWLFGRLRSDPR